jgi:DNA-binding GntR family transcriptional regulator
MAAPPQGQRRDSLGTRKKRTKTDSRKEPARTEVRDGPMTDEESLARAQSAVRAVVLNRHDRPSLVAHIACDVGAEIIEARVQPGADLNTVELARRYNSSRTPVREALMLLENEGLVEIVPRKRPRAKQYSIVEVREIYRTRAVLLDFVASEAAVLARDEDIELLRSILMRMQKASKKRDISSFMWASVELHDCNNRISKNKTVTRILDSLLLRTLSMRRVNVSQPGRMEETLEDHVRMVDAYERHDSRLAAAIIRANHTTALSRIEGYFQNPGSMVQLLPNSVDPDESEAPQ